MKALSIFYTYSFFKVGKSIIIIIIIIISEKKDDKKVKNVVRKSIKK